MGRLAQVLGVGVKGTVEIELLKREFYAGEFVVGHVKLTVKETIDAEGFQLTLAGKEHLSWHVQQGKSSHHHHIRQEILRQQIPLVAQATVFQPGEFVFPFQFQLPPGLPATFSVYHQNVQHLTRVMSSVLFKVTAEVKAKGIMTANITSEQKIAVHALPVLPAQPPRPTEDAVSRTVHFLCCFNQGMCRVSGTTSANYVDWLNGAVRVHGAVRNGTTRHIATVYVRLYQDFTIHIPDGFTHGGSRHVTTRLMHQVNLDGIPPGATKDSVAADISIAQIVRALSQTGRSSTGLFSGDSDLRQMQPFAQPLLHATTDLTFVSISYHIEIFCSVPWCSDVKLELPLAIHQLPIVPVAYAPMQPAT